MMITKTKRLRLCLKNIISSVYDNAYYMQATDEAQFPYITYEYSVRYADNKGTGTLEINVWDLQQSFETVEEIADNLETALHEFIYTDEFLVLKVYKDSRFPILDENEDIKRIRLMFEIQYYFGKEI